MSHPGTTLRRARGTSTADQGRDDTARCAVCNVELRGAVAFLGGRAFCPEHHGRISRENDGALSPLIILVAVLVVFAGVVALFAGVFEWRPEGLTLVLAGLTLGIVPAAVWLVAFYRQDRLEPEPKHYVLGTFILGGVTAEAIARPVLRDFYQIQTWLYDTPVLAVLGSILVVGFVQEFLKYAVVRYTVFNSPEFDERVDGIIYGAAAGLGFATVVSFRYVLESGGVDLGVGAMQIAIWALAHASYAGVTGYFLGRAKFEQMGPLWLPLGLTIAAVLNGGTSYVLRELPSVGTVGYNVWAGLIAAAVLAGATFAVLFATIRRVNRATVAAISRANA